MPNYSAYSPEQAELLPRHVRDELPAGHLCFLIYEVIETLKLSQFDEAYSEEGQKAYNPRLMLKLWLYGFAVNVRSSRKLGAAGAGGLGVSFFGGRVAAGSQDAERVFAMARGRHRAVVYAGAGLGAAGGHGAVGTSGD